ncbi:hypothetical protein K440DRAFT_425515 [Wilcoxina mikolae CBS 423.85]|nr:hypothetical protein K440DRAFT_425515 [Wilcoxina mikolae CBS 423.85]
MNSCDQLGVVCGDGSTIPNTGVIELAGVMMDGYGIDTCGYLPVATGPAPTFTRLGTSAPNYGVECSESNNITNFTLPGTPLTSENLESCESNNITNFTLPGTPSTASSIEWPESNAIANLTPPGTPLTTSSPVLPSYPDPAPQSTAGQQASMIECLDGDICGQTPYFVVPILASDPRDPAPVPVSPSLKRLPISRSLKRLTQPRARSPPCRYCGKDFSNNGNLGRHERETCSLNPPMYRCVRCGRGFPRKNNLDTHRTNGKCKKITRGKLNSKRASG